MFHPSKFCQPRTADIGSVQALAPRLGEAEWRRFSVLSLGFSLAKEKIYGFDYRWAD